MLFWVLVIFASLLPGSDPLLAGSGVCTTAIYYGVKVTKTHNVLKKYTFRKWNGKIGYKLEPVVESYTDTEYRTKTKEICCHGYTLLRGRCVPLCDRVCENSECTAPNTCSCREGYEKFNDFRCIPHCDKCVHGSCTAPGLCECYNGYVNNGENVCMPQCDPPCKNGICALPDTCECYKGFELAPNSTSECLPFCDPPCNTTILGSECTAPDQCTCPKGFTLKEGECRPVCLNCINGECIAPEECQCFQDYEKTTDGGCVSLCEMKGCENGLCSGPKNCTCFEGYKHHDEDWNRCIPHCDSCHNADCIEPMVCKCWKGYKLDEYWSCAPVCNPSCENANCTEPDVCTCLQDYEPNPNSTNSCSPKCEGCDYGDCFEPHICTCWEGYEWNNLLKRCKYAGEELDDLTQINSTTYPGLANETCDPLCINGTCENGFCHCPEGYSLADDSSNECVSDCEATCLYGICDDSNDCVCLSGYVKVEGACVSQCTVECVNGFCIEPDVCECKEGYVLDYNQTNANYCIPLCDSYEDGCINGSCVGPDLCECHEGFQLSPQSIFVCVLAESTSAQQRESLWWLTYLCVAICLLALLGVIYYMRGRCGEKAYDVDGKERREGLVKYDTKGEKIAVI